MPVRVPEDARNGRIRSGDRSIGPVRSTVVLGRRSVFTFGLLTALFAAGYGVMFTMLDDFRDEYGITATALGLVVAVGFFSSFLAQVLLAPLADRGHARRLVFLGMLCNVVGLLGMAVSERIVPLVVARLVMGLGAGMALPAARRIVILADPDNLGRNLGLLLTADVGGFAAGPAAAAVLAGPFGIPAPFLVIAALTVACLPVIIRVRVDETAREDAPVERFAFDLLGNRPYTGALALGAAVFLMIGTFDALWVLVLSDLRAADWIANIGITLFALPLMVLGPIGGRLSQRVGPFRLGTIGILGGAFFMFVYGHLASGAAMMVAAMAHSLSDGLTVSSNGVAVGLTVPAERQAAAQGLLGGVQTIVGGLTALSAGWLYEHHGRTWAYTACATAMVTLVAVAYWRAGPSWYRRGAGTLDAVAVPG
jgi:MFS family permease